MKKYFLLHINLLTVNICLHAQTTFNRSIDFSDGDETAYSVVRVDDGYVIGGHGYGYESADYYEVKLKFAKVDFEGNVIWQKVYVDSGYNVYCEFQSGIYLQDGSVVFGGHRLTDSTSEIIIIKIEPNSGDTIFYKTFDFDDWIYGLQVRQLSTGELIMQALDYNDIYGYSILKLTSNGDLIWHKSYGGTTELSSSNFEIDGNDHIWIINYYADCYPQWSIMREFDTAGTMLHQTFIYDYCLFAGMKTQDGGFFGPGGYYPIPPYETYTYRMDSLGQIQWVYGTLIDFDTLTSGELYTGIAKELPNGDIITTGYYGTDFGQYISIVSKVDINGNPVWERYYTCDENYYSSRFNALALTPDNGILITGVGFSDDQLENQNFWVIKLDSMGCLIPGCDTIGNTILNIEPGESIIRVFPNPVTYQSTVSISADHYIQNEDLHYTITDMTGRTIESQHAVYVTSIGNIKQFRIFNVTRLSGVFLITLFEGDRILGSTKIIFN